MPDVHPFAVVTDLDRIQKLAILKPNSANVDLVLVVRNAIVASQDFGVFRKSTRDIAAVYVRKRRRDYFIA